MAVDDPEDEGAEVFTIGTALEALTDARDEHASAFAGSTVRQLVRRAGGVPADLDAERRVVGAVLLDPDNLRAAVDEGLQAADFYKPGYASVWRAIVAVDAADEHIDLTRVTDWMRKHGEKITNDIGDAQLATIRAPSPDLVSSWARLVREKAAARRVLEMAENLIAAVVANTGRAGDVLDYAAREIERTKTATSATNAFARELQRARGEIRQRLSKAKWDRPIGKSMLDLARTEIVRRPSVVQGLVPDAAVVVLAGSPKGGKTWAEDELGIAVASGTKAFGEFYVNRPGLVMRLCLEDGEEQIHDRHLALAAGRHQALDDALGRIVYESRFALDLLSDDDVAGVVASCRMLPELPVLICIDPLADAHTVESENDNAGMRRVMGRARLLRDILGCAVLIVHHMTKLSGVDKKDVGGGIFDRFRGAGAIRGAYDAGIAYDVKSRQPGTIKTHIDVELRSARSPGPFGLQLDVTDGPDDRADRASWSFWRNRDDMTAGPGVASKDARQALGELRKEWLEAKVAEREAKPLSAEYIRTALGWGKQRIGPALMDLVERKLALHVPGTRNSGYVYFDAGGAEDE